MHRDRDARHCLAKICFGRADTVLEPTLPSAPYTAGTDYMTKAPTRRARHGRMTFFTQEEGPTLFKTCEALYPRWLAFIACSTLAGLRWGECAALERTDLDFKKATIHVQRSACGKTGRAAVPTDKEDRYVPMSRRLAACLRQHLEAMDLEAQLNGCDADARALVFPNSVGTSDSTQPSWTTCGSRS